MLTTAVRQFRHAYSILTGARFDSDGLRALVADARRTVDEFGGPTAEAREMISGPAGDPEMRREMAERRVRAAVRSARETPYYRRLLDGLASDPARMGLEEFGKLPVTSKEALRAAPSAFVRPDASPVFQAATSGTSGVPTSVWFSHYELDVLSSLAALSGLLTEGLRPHHVLASCVSSRATFTLRMAMTTMETAGAGFLQIGTIDPVQALDRIATPIPLPGKVGQVTHLSAAPSYLACLVAEAERAGWAPGDFGLQRIFSGGEIMTEALRLRAAEVFGATVADSYSATEISPASGTVCSQGHLHFSPETAYYEVLDPLDQSPVAPGEVGVLTVTPYPPYRDTTMLLRFSTGDFVRAFADDAVFACELAALPATSPILGRDGSGAGRFTRDVLEVLQGDREIPLPTRYAYTGIDGDGSGGLGDPVLHVLVDHDDPELRDRVHARLVARGVPVTRAVLVEDALDLPTRCHLRCDLTEWTYANTMVPTAVAGVR